MTEPRRLRRPDGVTLLVIPIAVPAHWRVIAVESARRGYLIEKLLTNQAFPAAQLAGWRAGRVSTTQLSVWRIRLEDDDLGGTP